MNYALAGHPIAGAARINESLLDIITERWRRSFRRLTDTMKKAGHNDVCN